MSNHLNFKDKFESLKCYLDENNIHFLNEPRQLPCSNVACLKCIVKLRDTKDGHFKCILCKSVHTIENVLELKKCQSIIDLIDKNSDEITIELEQNINKYVKNLNDQFKNKDEIIEKICENVKKDVADRVEATKEHLDVLHNELVESMNSIKERISIELFKLNTQGEKKIKEYKEFSDNMLKMLENFDQNKETIENDIYECQEYIDDLKDFEENFRKILRKVSFEPSDWLPDEKFICSYADKFEIEVDQKIQVNDS